MPSNFEDNVVNLFKNPDSSLNIKRIAIILAVVIVAIWILIGIFIVSPAEEAVVLRLGKYVTTYSQGPHWIPWPLETETTLNVQQISNFPYQAQMLTEDENIVSVAVAVQFRINNPRDYLFNIVDPVKSLRQATSSALRQIVGQMTLNDILTTGREDLREKVKEQLIKTLTVYKSGLEVMDVALQATKPPEEVIDAFNDAVKAREDSQRYINKAQAYSRRVNLSAQGAVARIKQRANAYKVATVLTAKGNIARYNALLIPYLQAKEITRERLYLDTMSTVLSQSTKIIVDGSNNIMYLPLQQILAKSLKDSSATTHAYNGDPINPNSPTGDNT